jgi:hypothetical protein
MNKLILSVIFAISSVSMTSVAMMDGKNLLDQAFGQDTVDALAAQAKAEQQIFDENLLSKAFAPDRAAKAAQEAAASAGSSCSASPEVSPRSIIAPAPKLKVSGDKTLVDNALNQFERPIGPVNAPKTPDRPWKKAYFNRKNGAYVAAALATVWATYAARQVAKNVPQQEWDKLSAVEKCKLVAQGTLPEMLSQAQRAVSYCTGR